MAKKKNISIQARRRLFFSRPICLFLVTFVIITLMYNIVEVYNLTNEQKHKEEEYIKLQDESDTLKNEIVKLSDPTYLANFAREHYLYSKEDELVIELKRTSIEDNVVKQDTKEFDYNFLIYVGVAFIIVIFVIIKIKKKYSDD